MSVTASRRKRQWLNFKKHETTLVVTRSQPPFTPVADLAKHQVALLGGGELGREVGLLLAATQADAEAAGHDHEDQRQGAASHRRVGHHRVVHHLGRVVLIEKTACRREGALCACVCVCVFVCVCVCV